MSFTGTIASTNTYTEARVQVVMLEVGAEFYCLAGAGLISYETANEWTEELNFILLQEAANGFQIQLRCEGFLPMALDYRVSSDGSLLESSKAGGRDYFNLRAGTKAGLFFDLNYSARKIESVTEYLRKRGCGFNGAPVDGPTSRDRAFSKDGYGVTRSKVGTWL